MRKSVIFALVVAACAMAIAALNTIPASAAGGWSAAFQMTGWISSWQPGAGGETSATFDIESDAITAVHISATGQHIEGGISSLLFCQTIACEAPVNAAISDAELIAIQDYDFDLDAQGVKTVTYWTPNNLSHEAEIVYGDVTGSVGGGFTVGDGPGKMAGSLSLDIEGSAGFACFAPGAGPLAPCMSGSGQMLPVEADIVAAGDYAIDITALIDLQDGDTVYELGHVSVDMDLSIDLTDLAHNRRNAVTASGEMTVSDVEVSYE
jgi:hypothetical protein